MEQNITSTIQTTAQEFFEKLGLQGEVAVTPLEENLYAVELTTPDAQMFIGEQGRVMLDIQYLLRGMLKKKTEEFVRISLDINGYRKSKESYLRELARTTADEVALLKKPRELEPMPSMERRVIHMELAERQDVQSESAGEGNERRVIIRPQN